MLFETSAPTTYRALSQGIHNRVSNIRRALARASVDMHIYTSN